MWNPVHHVPGRLRVRLQSVKGCEASAAATRAALVGIPGVTDVEVRILTGSVVVHYRTSATDVEPDLGNARAD